MELILSENDLKQIIVGHFDEVYRIVIDTADISFREDFVCIIKNISLRMA